MEELELQPTSKVETDRQREESQENGPSDGEINDDLDPEAGHPGDREKTSQQKSDRCCTIGFTVLINLLVKVLLAQYIFLPALVAEWKRLTSDIERGEAVYQANLSFIQTSLDLRSLTQANLTAESRRLRAILSAKQDPLCDLDTLRCRHCPLGWEEHNSRCYFLSKHTKNWQSSRRKCLDMGADLAVIRDEEEQVYLSNLTTFFYQQHPEVGFQGAWFGLQDMVKEGEYMWVNGQGLQPPYVYWRMREPNNYVAEWDVDQAGQDCVALVAPDQMNMDKPINTWDDIVCVAGRHFICETSAFIL